MARRSFRLAVGLVALAASGALTGCYTLRGLDNENTFPDAWKAYVIALRKGNWAAAAQYVEEDSRSAFIDEISTLDSIHISDHEYGNPEFSENNRVVDVVVVYRAFNDATLIETQFVENQHWYRDKVTGNWRVQPDLSGFKAIASGTSASVTP